MSARRNTPSESEREDEELGRARRGVARRAVSESDRSETEGGSRRSTRSGEGERRSRSGKDKKKGSNGKASTRQWWQRGTNRTGLWFARVVDNELGCGICTRDSISS